MSLLKQTLCKLDFPREINTFLSLLQSKAGFGSAKIDELYGLLPPLEITFQKTDQYKPEIQALFNTWGVNGILQLKCAWDRMIFKFYCCQGNFYAKSIQQHQAHLEFKLSTPLNKDAAGKIQEHSLKRLQLLEHACNDHVLRMLGIRQQLINHLKEIEDSAKRDFALEIILTMTASPLLPEEKMDYEAFLKRSYAVIAEILAYRGSYSAENFFSKFAGRSAARQSDKIYVEFCPLLCLLWGCLCNADFIASQKQLHRKYYFTETYYPNGKVEIGEILPALDQDKSGMEVRFGNDFYKQVFSSYESAVHFRTAALQMANQ